MEEKRSVVYVLAERLQHYMDEARISQNKLAKEAGVAQTAVGYILKPGRRQPTKSGKQKGPTLAQIEKVADYLKVPVWELLFPLPTENVGPRERELHQRIINSYRELADLTRGGEQGR